MCVELIAADVRLRVDGEYMTYRLSIHEEGHPHGPRVRTEMIDGGAPESGLEDPSVMDMLGVFSGLMFEGARNDVGGA